MPAQYPGNSVTKAARAASGGGFESAVSESVPLAPQFATSTTPTSITASITDSGGATSYQCSVDGSAWVEGLTVTGLSSATNYTFYVRGVNSVGAGPSSTQAVTTGASTGSPSITSVTDNGDGTITVQGSNFGAKAQPYVRHWEVGSELYLNGQSFTAPSIGSIQAVGWDTTTTSQTPDPKDGSGGIVSAARLRHQNVDRHWRAYGTFSLHGSTSFAGLTDEADNMQLYQAFWVYVGGRFGSQRIYTQTESQVGQFNISDSRQGGELCDLIDQGSVIESGKHQINWISPNGYITISPIGATNTNNLHGMTLRGVNSGAEITISSASSYTSPWSIKHFRFGQDGLASPSNIYGSWSNVNNGQTIIRAYDESSNVAVQDTKNLGSPGRTYPEEWTLCEIVCDFTNRSNGWIEWRLNGQRVGLSTGLDFSTATSQTAMQNFLLGIDKPGGVSPSDAGIGADFGEIVLDNSTKRIYLTTDAEVGLSKNVEIQRPISWSDNQITFSKNFGALSGPLRVAVATGQDISAAAGVL